MKLSDVRRFTPAHWIGVAIAVVCFIVAFALVANGAGFRWDPLNLAGKRADRAVAEAGRAKVEVAARSVEAAGARDTTRRVEEASAERAGATQILNDYAIQLEASDDESIPVPDAGADLRRVFGELCDLRPAVCSDPGHAAASGHAGDGAPGLPDPAAPG